MAVINILINKVNAIQNNASINFGNTIHKGHVSNEKAVGYQESYGDQSPSLQVPKNLVSDPDLIDQPTKTKSVL
jgi:hypothetical protein